MLSRPTFYKNKISNTMSLKDFLLLFVITTFIVGIKCQEKNNLIKYVDDICSHINGQRIYLEHGETGTLVAKYQNNFQNLLKFNNKNNNNTNPKRCTIEFVSCPSCIVQIKFRYLNISRNCDQSTVFDSCGCDYVWIYEPTFEQASGEQFCGRFIKNNISDLDYISQTRKVAVAFLYNQNYEHAFTLDYFSERNKVVRYGYPKYGNENNGSQIITSPFFPNLYATDLSVEHVIVCESNETCRISLVFTDFLISYSSIIEFFDWNGERLYVTTGNIFRPPVIVTSGPSLTIRFYANGVSNLGYKALYTFILGHFSDSELKPDIDCGGHVNNLGGGITMMKMVQEGTKMFDCIWLIKPPDSYYHMKTHLYIKVANFDKFAGSTELTIRHGLTSNGPVVEHLKQSIARFFYTKEKEHVVSISEGFYVSLKGLFRAESQLSIIYAAFNYKDCLSGSDFLCRNLRCISTLLNCDGFDHCGDDSDEFIINCSKDPKDRRNWSQKPNFLFPQGEGDLSTSTLIFLLASFSLIGLIFAMIMFLYRVNIKGRQQRNLQNHMETIHAILEEGVGEVEEEIIIPDDPPDYEAPPDYDDVIKMNIQSIRNNKNTSDNIVTFNRVHSKRCNQCSLLENNSFIKNIKTRIEETSQGTSRSCQTTPVRVPNSPPPAYNIHNLIGGPSSAVNGGGIFNGRIKNLPFFQKSKNCKCIKKTFLKNNISIERVEGMMNYFSDSELFCTFRKSAGEEEEQEGSDGTRQQTVICFKFSKSYTTDDLYFGI